MTSAMTQLTESQKMWRIAAKYSALGIEMTMEVGGCTWLGIWLDKKLETAPVLMWVGIVVGFAAAFRAVQRTIRDYKRDIKDAEPPKPMRKDLN